jgi:DNA-directed RNA polymerase-4 subunit 1
MKWMKDAVLSKWSDNAFCTTVVGDPKIRWHEIGISMDLALNLVVYNHVNYYNIKSINLNCNLDLRAKEIVFTQRNEKLIHVKKQNHLQIGDIVYMPLQNGNTNKD